MQEDTNKELLKAVETLSNKLTALQAEVKDIKMGDSHGSRYWCNNCKTKGVFECNHCFKCGSVDKTIYKTFQNSSKNLAEYNKLQQTITEVSNLIYEKKNDYYNALAIKLSDPATSSKTNWSVLKNFYNNKRWQL